MTSETKFHPSFINMPTRILREGIISSERVNSLTERGELFYRKLMSVVDDYGRFFANTISILGSCYPMRPDVCEADVKQFLNECVEKGLVVIYGGGKYLLMLEFRQQTRSRSKFPEPTANELLIKCKADSQQMSRVVGGEGAVGGVVECVRAHDVAEKMRVIGEEMSMEYGRKGTRLSYMEESTLAEICRTETVAEDWIELLAYKHSLPPDRKRYFPSSIPSLLTNWQKTLDTSRNRKESKTAPDYSKGF